MGCHALGKADERRLIVCVAVTSAGGLLATFLGCDLFRNVLLVNIQPWRVWLAALIANAGIGLILLRLPKTWFSRELFLWAAHLSMLVTLRLQITSIAALSQLLAALAFGLERQLHMPLPKLVQLLFLIAPITGAVVTGFVLYAEAARTLAGCGAHGPLRGGTRRARALRSAQARNRPRALQRGGHSPHRRRPVRPEDRLAEIVEAAAPDPELQAFVAGSRNLRAVS